MSTGTRGGWTRRQVLGASGGGLALLAVAGTAGLDMVSRGVLPGQQVLDRLDGSCSVARPPMTFSAPGPSVSGRFFSRARRRVVGYTIAWPPGYQPGSRLPLIIALHPFGSDHRDVLTGMSLQHALALQVDGKPLPPMAMVSADGGRGYWNPHPGDNPAAMVIDELVPLCQRKGLGRNVIGAMGISMGGYGAILLAEKYPQLIRAVAAIGPAIWTSYPQARAASPGAYASAAAFTAADVVTHASALAATPVRVACGLSDPFRPGAHAFARALPGAVVDISHGCHGAPFFTAQEPPSLAFLARHLTGV